MAVVSCTEIFEGQDGEFNARGLSRRYTRNFSVKTDDGLDGAAVVVAYLSLPALYSSYTSGNDIDTAAYVDNVRAQRLGPKLWHATVDYSTITPDAGQNVENPVDRAATVRWSSQSYQVPVTQDINGTPILNSAGDPFDPPVEREDKRRILNYSRFENSYSQIFADLYENAVNEDVFMGADPGYCRCNHIHGERHYEKGAYTWKVDYEFEFRREGYEIPVLDQGFRYLDSNDVAQTIRDGQGTPVSSPALLNGIGGLLTDSASALFFNVGAADAFLPMVSFPPAPFIIKIGDEKIRVGTKEAIGFSDCTRGYAGTTAAAHLGGAAVTLCAVYILFQLHRPVPFADLNIIV
jgi:hypothetical protein